MKIGMMTLWNAANGPSIHAELVGREWIKMGHKLIVFSAIKHPDARKTGQKDEDFVIRHFVVEKVKPFTRSTYFDPEPLLKNDYEVFVAQNLERLPIEKLLEIYPAIREKAVTVLVVHEGKEPDDPLFFKFDWDAIVCFDERYMNFLLKYYPAQKIKIIPYPCYPWQPGNKTKARETLGLPLSKKIIFSYGFRPEDAIPVLNALKDLYKKYDFLYVIVVNPESQYKELLELQKDFKFLKVSVKPLPFKELYQYLYAADLLLVHRESSKTYYAVISSTVRLALGSGCPILFHESNFVEKHNGEIIKYRDFEDLKDKIVQVFLGKIDVREKVLEFLKTCEAPRVAREFVNLFEKLLEKRKF